MGARPGRGGSKCGAGPRLSLGPGAGISRGVYILELSSITGSVSLRSPDSGRLLVQYFIHLRSRGVPSRRAGAPSRGRSARADAHGKGPSVRDATEADPVEGPRVEHPLFGSGRVTRRQGSGDKLKLTIDFGRAGIKQVVARYAKLRLYR